MGMKKFNFQFETLERVRKSREEEAQRSLGGAQRALRAAIDHKEKLSSDLQAILLHREQLSQKPILAAAFQLDTAFIDGQKIRIIQQESVIARARRAVEKALRTYLAARRQTRMIEVLKEKALSEFKIERIRFEQKNLDDLTVMRERLKEPA